MMKKIDFSEKVDSDEMLKIPIQPISGEYVNEGNPQVFIAGQVKCFVKFWEMIMTQQCRVIVGFPETRTQFYPKVKRSKTYGNVKVSTLEKRHFDYFSIIILEALSQTNEYESISRKIFLFEFKNWADYDVISTSSRFVWFVNKVTENTIKISDGSSVIVYGSDEASSLFVAYQQLALHLKYKNKINIYQLVVQLRTLNARFFSTMETYILLHQLLLEIQILGNTDLTLSEAREKMTKSQFWFQTEFDFLEKTVKYGNNASVVLPGDFETEMVCVTYTGDLQKVWMKIFAQNPDLIVCCDKTKSLMDLGFSAKLHQNFDLVSLTLKNNFRLLDIKNRINNSKRTVMMEYLESTKTFEDLILASNILCGLCREVTKVVVIISCESLTVLLLCLLTERIKSQSKFDVFRAVRDLGLFVTKEQYELLYKCLLHHKQEIDIYANTTC
uniref:uncharacterized protein LOC101242992 isoform X2 n=1 Tax=Ciona intestinalis TaxID=7719 RepID=UPI000EF4BD9C|nr:uncharacterized protein LOC101242992 isoform X2 [Ciona intestinalis]|eukprot:XP_009858862.2 uncharacterized protein LOC101242992 isoform X2 [Ciona intestinalis]